MNILLTLVFQGAQCSHIHDSETDSESLDTQSVITSDSDTQHAHVLSDDSLECEPEIESQINNQSAYQRLEFDTHNKPGDSLPVTLVECSSFMLPVDNTTQLYYFIAGTVVDDVQFKNDRQVSSTMTVLNDVLHGHIKAQCEIDLLSGLDHIMRRKLEQHTPCFVVTERPPLFGTDEVNFASIKPSIQKDEHGRLFFSYVHSRNPDLYIQVFEPASPSPIKIHLSQGTVLTSTLQEPTSPTQVC